ncbi:MAG: alpha/beta hydrolase [Solirubrobacteraceae bacterium]
MALPTPVVAQSVRALGAIAFRPGLDWATSRKLIELGLKLPGPPRGTTIKSIEIGGVQCEEVRAPGATDDRRALLYLHGGGYVVCSPRTHRVVTAAMAQAFGARMIVPDYRLAPEHPYPAALEDAQAVWHALTNELDPSHIAVAGDSAGAGLALALTLSLPKDAPKPRALGLISPWLDATKDLDNSRPPAPKDYLLNPDLMYRFATAYIQNGADPSDPLISPLRGELDGLPPLVVHVAGNELLRADGDELAETARAQGIPVIHETLEGLWHDPHLSARLLPEPAHGAAGRMAAALRSA